MGMNITTREPSSSNCHLSLISLFSVTSSVTCLSTFAHTALKEVKLLLRVFFVFLLSFQFFGSVLPSAVMIISTILGLVSHSWSGILHVMSLPIQNSFELRSRCPTCQHYFSETLCWCTEAGNDYETSQG